MELGERKDACPSFLSTIAKKVAKGRPRFRKGESPSVDIVISVILIIIITEFAQIGHTLMDSVMIGILFTGLIAFFKVTLDRFYIIPKVWEWGWKRYPREVQITRQTFVETTAVSIMVAESIRRQDEPEVTYELFRTGIQQLPQI